MSPHTLITLFSILLPVKVWCLPNQPLPVIVQAPATSLVLTDFSGKPLGTPHPVHASKDTPVDVHELFADELAKRGTYVLYAVSSGKAYPDFVGTPLVIEVRAHKSQDNSWTPMILRIQPLSYAVISTDLGDMTLAFYYDVAPNTVENFQRLCEEGFYDGLTFHHIIPDFYIQGGDPGADGNGGPGYQLAPEFNAKLHEAGVVTMWHTQDANTAGSQFLICIDHTHTRHMDAIFTDFGRVLNMDVVHKLEHVPQSQADPRANKPAQPQYIRHLRVLPVTPGQNPYANLVEP